jgi:hypothetical protein
MKYLNRYTFFARYLPGLISIFPLTLIYFFVTKTHTDFELKEYFESITFILGISATFVLTFFISMITREFGTFLEKKYFNDRSNFPTNYLMLYQNNKLPFQSKEKYGEKIQSDFGLKRLNEFEEKGNIDEAIKILAQASRVLSTRYQQNEQVKDANIAYGFSRNISGGLFLSLPASITGIIIGLLLKENSLILWSIVSTIIFLSIAFFHKGWIKQNAEKYAEKLFSVYLLDK